MAELSTEKTVLITGATGALGGVVARTLAARGQRLVLTARRGEALLQLQSELGMDEDRVLALPADLAVPGQVDALASTAAAQMGSIDVLLNTTGGWSGGKRVAGLDAESWDHMMNMNARTAFLVSRAVLPYMLLNKWGRIVHVGSSAVERPGARQAAYNASKAALVALTESIAADYRRSGIAANVIMPSIIDTPANRAQMPDAKTSRWVQPAEIAAMMLFLCSDEGSSLNGARIPMVGRV